MTDNIHDDLLDAYAAPDRPPIPPPANREARDEKARQELMPYFFKRSREHWKSVGDAEHLAMSEEEFAREFWLVDHEGLPRFKPDEGQVEIPPGTALNLAKSVDDMPHFFGPRDRHHGDLRRRQL